MGFLLVRHDVGMYIVYIIYIYIYKYSIIIQYCQYLVIVYRFIF